MFDKISDELTNMIFDWELKFNSLSDDIITSRRNSQNRNIKQIVGHMIDSASNNTHRIVHLQYQNSPFNFPNYATFGNNNRWISIQNYENENRENLLQLWKYSHLHFIHVTGNINPQKLKNEWISGANTKITLQEMVEDFPRHFLLHIEEINDLINTAPNTGFSA